MSLNITNVKRGYYEKDIYLYDNDIGFVDGMY